MDPVKHSFYVHAQALDEILASSPISQSADSIDEHMKALCKINVLEASHQVECIAFAIKISDLKNIQCSIKTSDIFFSTPKIYDFLHPKSERIDEFRKAAKYALKGIVDEEKTISILGAMAKIPEGYMEEICKIASFFFSNIIPVLEVMIDFPPEEIKIAFKAFRFIKEKIEGSNWDIVCVLKQKTIENPIENHLYQATVDYVDKRKNLLQITRALDSSEVFVLGAIKDSPPVAGIIKDDEELDKEEILDILKTMKKLPLESINEICEISAKFFIKKWMDGQNIIKILYAVASDSLKRRYEICEIASLFVGEKMDADHISSILKMVGTISEEKMMCPQKVLADDDEALTKLCDQKPSGCDEEMDKAIVDEQYEQNSCQSELTAAVLSLSIQKMTPLSDEWTPVSDEWKSIYKAVSLIIDKEKMKGVIIASILWEIFQIKREDRYGICQATARFIDKGMKEDDIVSTLRMLKKISENERKSVCETAIDCFIEKGVPFSFLSDILSTVAMLPNKRRGLICSQVDSSADIPFQLQKMLIDNCEELTIKIMDNINLLTEYPNGYNRNIWLKRVQKFLDLLSLREADILEKSMQISPKTYISFFSALSRLESQMIKNIGAEKIQKLLPKVPLYYLMLILNSFKSGLFKGGEEIWSYHCLFKDLLGACVVKCDKLCKDYESDGIVTEKSAKTAAELIEWLRKETDQEIEEKMINEKWIETLEKLIMRRICDIQQNKNLNIVKDVERIPKIEEEVSLTSPLDAHKRRLERDGEKISNLNAKTIPLDLALKCMSYDLKLVIKDLQRCHSIVIGSKKINLKTVQESLQKGKENDLTNQFCKEVISERLEKAIKDKRFDSIDVKGALAHLQEETQIEEALTTQSWCHNSLITSIAAYEILDALEVFAKNSRGGTDDRELSRLFNVLSQGIFSLPQAFLQSLGFDFSAGKNFENEFDDTITYTVDEKKIVKIETHKTITSAYIDQLLSVNFQTKELEIDKLLPSLLSSQQKEILTDRLVDEYKEELRSLGVYKLQIICDLDRQKVSFTLELLKENNLYNKWNLNLLKKAAYKKRVKQRDFELEATASV